MADLRLTDLLALGDCVICGKKQLEGGLPLFYVVEITRDCFRPDALRRAAGLEMQIGPLAAIMGPNEELSQMVQGPHRVFVHETCADIGHLIRLFPEDRDNEDRC